MVRFTDDVVARVAHRTSGKRPPCFLLHRDTFFHPSFFVERWIPFNVLVQQEGDLFLPDAAAAHEGWNAGCNLAEAVNYADVNAFVHVQECLIDDKDRCAWPCVCGKVPVPGLKPSDSYDEVQFYDPSKDKRALLSCSTFYEWFLLLRRNLVPHVPNGKDLIPAQVLVDMRARVYTRMRGE